jgi:hypothetical protein
VEAKGKDGGVKIEHCLALNSSSKPRLQRGSTLLAAWLNYCPDALAFGCRTTKEQEAIFFKKASFKEKNIA